MADIVCLECGGDEHHAAGCTQHPRHQKYWLGYRHGKRLAAHEPNVNHEPTLKLDLLLQGNGPGRPFALGELRGYRQAADLPQPLYGHRVISERRADTEFADRLSASIERNSEILDRLAD
jgi:hypothetical protein